MVEDGADAVTLGGRTVDLRLQTQRWHRKSTNKGVAAAPHYDKHSDEDRTLVLSNLAWVTTAQDLKVALDGCGGAEVEAARLEYLADGRPAGSAYLRFTTPEGARAAIRHVRRAGGKFLVDNRAVNVRLQSSARQWKRPADPTALPARQRQQMALRALADQDASLEAECLARRVVVTGLPYSARQDDLETLFTGCVLEDCVVLRATLGGMDVPTGAAVVQLASEEEAEEALLHLNGQTVRGRPVSLQLEADLAPEEEEAASSRASRDLRRVRVSNLHPSTTWKDLKDLGRQLGPVAFAQVRSMGSAKVGTLEFLSTMHARMAPTHLSGLNLLGSPIKVELYQAGAAAAAAAAREPDATTKSAGDEVARRCRVFVTNLPWSMTSDNVMASVAPLLPAGVSSTLERCDVLRRKSDGRSLGSAILSFTDADSAAAAIELINEVEFEGRAVFAREDREA